MYFLGIGGIGMSALARYFKQQQVEVYGYDLTPSPLTDELEYEGMHIHYDEDIQKIPSNIDLVVYTPAIPEDNTELIFLRKQDIPLLKRAELIGKLSEEYDTIAVAGTHGKTSITALIAHLLKTAGIPLTAFIGGICNNFNSNLVLSRDPKYLIVEADEFDRSFLQLQANIAIISSMDADHLDVYHSIDQLHESFIEFAENMGADGYLIYNEKLDKLESLPVQKQKYGMNDSSDLYATDIRVEGGAFVFTCAGENLRIEDLQLSVPGYHYIENTLASIAVALQLGLAPDQIKEGIKTFQGIKRRFEFICNTANFVFVDDYAHHPSEISATITAIQMLYPDRNITAVFQPHLYSRTNDFALAFAQSLESLDEIILLDIYPAREKPMEGVDSALILGHIKNQNKKVYSKAQLLHHLKANKPDVLLTLGAGDIGLLVNDLKNLLLDI